MNEHSLELVDVSFSKGGFFYQLEERLRLVNVDDSRVVVRAVVFALIAYLPVLALAAIQGVALNDDPQRSLLLDYAAYVRPLVAIPFFILAENLIDDRYIIVTSFFRNSGVIGQAEMDNYLHILDSSSQLLVSRAVEFLLIAAAYALSVAMVWGSTRLGVGTWRIDPHTALTMAGWWSLLISLPLFNFFLLRWIWRYLIWVVLLWRLAGLKLRLISTHPDAIGGLGILSESMNAFAPIFFALSAVIASVWAKRMVYDGVKVSEYMMPFAAIVIGSLLIAGSPLLIFSVRLIRLKLRGLHDYGVMANLHSIYFDDKWIRNAETNMPDVLGAADISSLADMGTGYEKVQSMWFIPIRLQNIAVVAGSVTAPMVPLLLLEIPLKDLLIQIGGALL